MATASKGEEWETHCKRYPVERATIEHFAASPSTGAYLQDPNYDPIPSFCRVLKPSGEDSFFAKVIATPATIPHFLTLIRRGFGCSPLPTPEEEAEAPPDTLTLITFGSGDLVGYPNVVHGGVSTALLDEPMSFLLHMYQVRIAAHTPKNSSFTVNLNVNFRAAVPAPGQVVVECRLLKVEGRKYFVSGAIKDSSGKVLVDARGLWLSARPAHL